MAAGTLAVAVAVAASACGADPPDPGLTAPPPAAGYTRVIGVGFTIDMPASWPQPALTPAAFEQTAAALRADNPQLAQALEAAIATMGSGNRLFAIDPADGSTVNLMVTDAGDRSLADLVADGVRQLGQVGVGSLRQEKTTVGTIPAVRLEFTLAVTASGGTVVLPETQLYVVRDKRLFILTLFGANPSLTAVEESLRIS